jgi:hypothetical protein
MSLWMQIEECESAVSRRVRRHLFSAFSRAQNSIQYSVRVKVQQCF